MRREAGASGQAIDNIAFATAFKIVMLEGIEVVFIVIAIGAGGGLLLPAVIGALLALLVVVLLSLWLHKPLANVPENALKFGVGVMLAAFGTFWVGEGVGIDWPGADWVLLILIAAFLLVALVLVPVCWRLQVSPRRSPPARKATSRLRQAGALARIWDELVGLFVDDGLLAVGIVVWAAGAWAVSSGGTMAPALAAGAIFAVGLAALLSVSALRCARQ